MAGLTPPVLYKKAVYGVSPLFLILLVLPCPSVPDSCSTVQENSLRRLFFSPGLAGLIPSIVKKTQYTAFLHFPWFGWFDPLNNVQKRSFYSVSHLSMIWLVSPLSTKKRTQLTASLLFPKFGWFDPSVLCTRTQLTASLLFPWFTGLTLSSQHYVQESSLQRLSIFPGLLV